jgi:hypothetical protein
MKGVGPEWGLAHYWRWFASLSDPARAQVTAPLLNKPRALLLRSPFARQLLCGGPSTINLTTVPVRDWNAVLLCRRAWCSRWQVA